MLNLFIIGMAVVVIVFGLVVQREQRRTIRDQGWELRDTREQVAAQRTLVATQRERIMALELQVDRYRSLERRPPRPMPVGPTPDNVIDMSRARRPDGATS